MRSPSWLSLILLCLSACSLFLACPAVDSRREPVVPPSLPPAVLPPSMRPPTLPPSTQPAREPEVAASFLTPLEQALADEINLACTQPRTYAAFLGQAWSGPGSSQPRRSGIAPIVIKNHRSSAARQEGRLALDEAVAFLHSTAPLPPLTVSRGMSSGARDHVREQGHTGAFGHQGRDGTYVDQRVNCHGAWLSQISENLSYGFDNARLMTVNLIIDDGVPDRGHRNNIFDPQARVMGLACGPHPATQIVCVMTFADDYSEGIP